MFGMVNISMIAVVFLVCLILAAFVAGFIYKDAKKRNMNALLWAILAVVAPFFLGAILYMICRTPITELQCPKCGTAIASTDRSCPNCGDLLLTQCPSCEFPVQRGWENCPKCGNPLPKEYGQPVREYKKDNNLGIVIMIVILTLLALFLGIVPSLVMKRGGEQSSEGYAGFTGMYNITAEDMAENEAIASWIEESEKSKDDVFVLWSKESNTCLVYVKENKCLLENTYDVEYILYGDEEECDVMIYIEETMYVDNYGYDFLLFEMELREETAFYIYINGELCDDVTVSTTDKDISWNNWGGQENE